MKKLVFSLLFSLPFIAICQNKYSLEDLAKAKWINISKGVDYIITKNTNDLQDSNYRIEIALLGMSSEDSIISEFPFKDLKQEDFSFIQEIINQNLKSSEIGYLRLNFSELLEPIKKSIVVYLKEPLVDNYSHTKDSIILSRINGVDSIKFISKDDAKEKFLSEGNEDWNNVLEENPLPSSFDILLTNSNWNEKSLEELKEIILKKLPNASSVIYPFTFLKENKFYFFTTRDENQKID